MGVRSRAMEDLAVISPRPDAHFWRSRRVLLTGHTGFKGAWATLWLARMGAKVTGFSLPPESDQALFVRAGLAREADSRIGDLRSPDMVRQAVAASDPEIVLHFAAQPLVQRSIADPIETLATNVMGTAHLLEALRAQSRLERILVVTSDKVYRNLGDGKAFHEDDPLGGKDPYSASKAATELIVGAYAKTYFAGRDVIVVTARGGNVIGGGDIAENRIVPDIVRAWLRGERPVLRMPEATRPWQHVLDCLSGYFLFVERAGPEVPTALNFGPDPKCAVTVAELARAMLAALGAAQIFETAPMMASVEQQYLSVDSSRAFRSLGWRNTLSDKTAVAWTADWYRRLQSGEDARTITMRQIDAYCALDDGALTS